MQNQLLGNQNLMRFHVLKQHSIVRKMLNVIYHAKMEYLEVQTCENAIFHWPTTYPYNTTYSLTCDGTSSCENTIINVTSNGLFTCNGRSGCKYSTINCPQDNNCTIDCNDDYSCSRTKINCPRNIRCNNIYGSCSYSDIIWPYNSTGTLSCASTSSCRGVNRPSIYPDNNQDFYLNCIP
eukprot:141743_1